VLSIIVNSVIQQKFLTLCKTRLLTQIRCIYVHDLYHLNFHPLRTRRRISLLIFMIVLNFLRPCLKMLAFALLSDILETFLYLLLVPSLLDAHEQHTPFANIQMYLQNNWLHSITF
jgi:hypothetical protein